MDSESRRFVGLDVGGTTMKAGVVDDAGQLKSHATMPTQTDRGQEAGLQTMAECIRRAVAAASLNIEDVTAIGVAVPGSLDLVDGVILDPPNLKPWRNVPVKQFITDTFARPVAFQNDANAAVFGEFWVGIGREYRSLVLFTLGTGIGGGIVLDGKILEGAHSHGGELGQTKIEATNGRLCGCGQRGCLEAYASATAVVKRTEEELAQSDEDSSLRRTLKEKGLLTAKDIFLAARHDPLAIRIVDRTAFYLGVACANVMHTINPELICFAGGMTGAGPPFLDAIRGYARSLAFARPAERTIIEYSALGSDAGVIGAAGCARMLIG
ncbi:MAG: ROK family protein [Gemmataceae bacterium]